MPSRLHDLGDWLFRDRTSGRIVIAQMPNAAAWVALAAFAFRLFVPAGRATIAAGYVLIAALLLWAFDEIARGVNPWRRILGTVALGGVVIWLLAHEGLLAHEVATARASHL